jgi:hypothetical protein
MMITGISSGGIALRFPKVTHAIVKKGCCAVCLRAVQRQKKFSQHLSPFNTAEDCHVKNRDEIHGELVAEAAAWQPNFRHKACTLTRKDKAIS